MRYLFLLGLLTTAFTLSAQHESSDIAEGVITVVDLFNASENDQISCYRIPAIVTASNGDLIAAIDERVPSCGDLMWSRDINIVLRRSQDNGVSWSEIERVLDFPDGQSASDPSMILDAMTGVVFLFYNYMDLDKEKDVYYLHFIKSIDNGNTWSAPIDITGEISRPEWHNDFKFITSGRGLQTRSGKLVHCLVNLDNGMHIFGSDDHGESWYLIETPIKPANESKIIELSDGTWMVNSRVQGQGYRHVHRSADEGQTWISLPDTSLIDPSCNASIINYSDPGAEKESNILLFSNARSKNGRMNMSVRMSTDNGVSWSQGKTIYPGSSAYSSMTVMQNGAIGLFFEKDNYTQNTFVSFSLEWLSNDNK